MGSKGVNHQKEALQRIMEHKKAMKDKFLKLLNQDTHSEEDLATIVHLRKKISPSDLSIKEIQILTKILLT